ncbi:hypothetical protein R69608_01139 [Paraburkholderia nemoris]|uniref:TauD/TfdA-like domain-containing protein n=2 Tax=Paraburkholderia nemoris TaxID=2793076 RepID=A0ABM8R7U4_9BURK|nr:TauD/TfdA family dioxygenase [Paraburkholderia aspalathi]MBK5147772.1 TauD/TfdA family dioxygenase [Burkholderia sp. R-69608]CAE6737868.1 hypothetical protein R69776_02301 [Paraburkholderia nemoris]MBK3810721.1 TauD/TfdA family dioxygenase [Paraburkholderia aspalathi]CAE6757845.1 hypothetical protein R75777_03303 [Paraburkholderia nemoris]
MDALMNRDVLHVSGDLIEQNGSRLRVIHARAGESIDALIPSLTPALLDTGGVLLRGFDALGADGLQRVAALLGEPLEAYEFGSSPRTHVDKAVFSSTEYPANQWIEQHNEQSYTTQWPSRILFYCETPATRRGQTPVADSREVYRRLDASLRRRFDDRKIMYVRNFGNGLDVPWQQVFGTDDHAAVERFCRARDIGFEWLDDGEALRTRQICQSEWRHPVTGETVWFNQAHLFHVTNLPEDTREALLELVDEASLPRNTYFGDGTPIDPLMLDEIRAVYRNTTLSFDWHAADLLILDNVLMSHGRAPFEGKRRVLVAMAA